MGPPVSIRQNPASLACMAMQQIMANKTSDFLEVSLKGRSCDPVCFFNLPPSCCLKCQAPEAVLDQKGWATPRDCRIGELEGAWVSADLMEPPWAGPWTPTSGFTLYETNFYLALGFSVPCS